MFLALARARRLIGVWTAVTAVTTVTIVIEQDKVSLWGGLADTRVWIAAGAGMVVACLASPVLTARWMRWYWGALIGLPLGSTILFLFFFLRPHAWQPSRLDAWKSVGMIINLYPLIILPACLLAGALGALVICRDTEPIRPEG